MQKYLKTLWSICDVMLMSSTIRHAPNIECGLVENLFTA